RDRDVALVAGITAPIDDPTTAEDHIDDTLPPSLFPLPACQQRDQRDERQPQCAHVLLKESGGIIRPRIITQAMCRVAPMSAAGSASRPTRSATLPGAIRPSQSASMTSAPLPLDPLR